LHCNQEGNSSLLHLTSFYSFLFTILKLIIQPTILSHIVQPGINYKKIWACPPTHLKKIPLAMVQLNSKVTFPHISDVSRMCSRHIPRLAKNGMALTHILLQLYREVLRLHRNVSCAFQMHLTCGSDTSCMRFRRVWTLTWSWAVP